MMTPFLTSRLRIMAADLLERYTEQLTTTAETMCRRGLTYYDGLTDVGKRFVIAAERLKDVAEPAAMDAKDYIMNAYAVTEPIEKLSKSNKNLIVELYLGISVFMLGLAGAELSGTFALPPLLEAIFNRSVEIITFFLIPVYAYLYIKKTYAMDDTDRRNLLMNVCIWTGALAGHLVPSLSSLGISSSFLLPLLVALIIDNELLVNSLPSLDRPAAIHLAAGGAAIGSLALGSLTVGVTAGMVVFTALHAVFMVLHVMIALNTVNEKGFSNANTQFTYIAGVVIIQLLTATLLGRSPLSADATTPEPGPPKTV